MSILVHSFQRSTDFPYIVFLSFLRPYRNTFANIKSQDPRIHPQASSFPKGYIGRTPVTVDGRSSLWFFFLCFYVSFFSFSIVASLSVLTSTYTQVARGEAWDTHERAQDGRRHDARLSPSEGGRRCAMRTYHLSSVRRVIPCLTNVSLPCQPSR